MCTGARAVAKCTKGVDSSPLSPSRMRLVASTCLALMVSALVSGCGNSAVSTSAPRLSLSLPPPYNPAYHTHMYGPPPNTVAATVGTVVLISTGRHFDRPTTSDSKVLPMMKQGQDGCSRPKCYVFVAQAPGSAVVSTKTPSGCNLPAFPGRCVLGEFAEVRVNVVPK